MFSLCLLSLIAISHAILESKMQNGPPESFEKHRVPQPSTLGERERSALFHAVPTYVADAGPAGFSLQWQQDVYADSDSVRVLSFL